MPYNFGGKHCRLLFDSKRNKMVLAGGDYENTYIDYQDGMPMIWSIDLSQTTPSAANWTGNTLWCQPSGGVQPARPDTVGWVYDSKRDKGVMTPGFYFGTQNTYANCNGVTEYNNAMVFDFATNRWSVPAFPAPSAGYGGDAGSSYAVYDPVTDSVYRFRYNGYGWGNTVEILNLATNTWSTRSLGASDSKVRSTDPDRDQPAIDVTGRAIYFISRTERSVYKYSIATKDVVDKIPLPSQWTAPSGGNGGDMETWLVFDPNNRVLLNVNTAGDGTGNDFNGLVNGLGIYHVDTKQTEWESAPPSVGGYVIRGNVLGFDIANNVMMLIGGHNSPQVFWLYRFANGAGSDTTPPSAPKNVQITN
jgi:hypothetical protein